MTRRLQFDDSADVQYLAHLCHNCGACLHACQYAPPHEFAVNVPLAMAPLRRLSYQQHAWPALLGGAYQRHGLVLSLALVAAFALCLLLAVRPVAGGSFYSVIPHGLMVGLFAPVFAFALLALGIGVWRFWRQADPGRVGAAAVAEAAHDATTLRYLGGGHGQGCNNDDDAWTQARRHAHHALAGGFMLCFAATTVGTLYHYVFGWVAPYGWTSLPKLLGTSGGVLMLIGAAALGALRASRHPLHVDAGAAALDVGLIAVLGVVAATGLALALAAGTALMRCCCACTWARCWPSSPPCPTASLRMAPTGRGAAEVRGGAPPAQPAAPGR